MAEANIHALHTDCLKSFNESVEKSLREVESFFGEPELQQIFGNAKEKSLSKVK